MRSARPLTLRDGNRGGVFFLFGEDEFQKEEEARSLVAWHLDPATKDFNFDPLRGSEVSVESLATVLATPPMMADWRVVVLREVEALASSARAREALLEVATSPPPGLALILLASIPPRSKARIYGDLKRRSRSLEFPSIGPNDLPGWIMARAAEALGREITEEAARALASGAGSDLGVLARELEKLSSLVPEGEPIGLDAVRAAGTFVPSVDRWAWLDRVGRRELGQALEEMEVLFLQGESAVGLTIHLATHLLRVALGLTGGAEGVKEILPQHQQFLVPRLLEQAREWSLEDMDHAILGLRRVDRILKSSTVPAEHVMEEWLLGMMARQGAVR